MSRDPINWKDNVVEHPNRYKMIDNEDGSVDLIREAGRVWEEGTAVNAVNLNIMDRDILKKANKAPEFIAGNLASLDENGDLQDSEKKAEDFLLKSDVAHDTDIADESKVAGADVTAGLQGQINDLSASLAQAVYSSDLMAAYDTPSFLRWDINTLNTPYKNGLTGEKDGFAFSYGRYDEKKVVVALCKGSNSIFINADPSNEQDGWKELESGPRLSSDILDIPRKMQVCSLIWNENTLNTPFKDGMTDATHGFTLGYSVGSSFAVVIAFAAGKRDLYIRALGSGIWSDWEEIGDLNTNIDIISDTILEFVLKNKSNKKDAFVTLSHIPSDAPEEAREGYVQILRSSDGRRIIVRFHSYYGSNTARVWCRTIYDDRWYDEWVANVTNSDLKIQQASNDINDYFKSNTDLTKSYFITNSMSNIPVTMGDHAILTVHNFGLYTTMSIVDSIQNQFYWSGWNTQTITADSWNLQSSFRSHSAFSTNLGLTVTAGINGTQKHIYTAGVQTTTWKKNVKYGIVTMGGIYAPLVNVQKQIIYKRSGDQICYGLFEIDTAGNSFLTPFNVAVDGEVAIYETYL